MTFLIRFDQMGIIFRDSPQLNQFLDNYSSISEFYSCPKFLIQVKKAPEVSSLRLKLQDYTQLSTFFNGIENIDQSQINSLIMSLIENP